MGHPYASLTPDLVLDAIASTGLEPDGRLLPLNSYENRVFQVGIDDAQPMVAKFYRPDRWEDGGILEEHAFSTLLSEAEVPIVAPWRSSSGHSLFRHAGFRFALFPRRGGRAPEPGDLEQLRWIGRFIGRLHLTGQDALFSERPALGTQTLGWPARQSVLQSPLLPLELASRYAAISEALLGGIEAALIDSGAHDIRLHGDCHHGNILWSDTGPHFVDLDDCRNGPAVQDLWMLLNGSRAEQTAQIDALIEGYRMFRDFDLRELALIEPLRGLRMVHYSGWIAQRWDDPAFPDAFSWIASPHYWQEHVEDLAQQLEALDEAPLQLF